MHDGDVATPAHLRPSPLLGRDREQAICRQLTDEVGKGQSACLALTGEPGIGKTRLARELLGQLVDQGWHVGEARADEATSNIPFWLAHRSVRDIVDVSHRREVILTDRDDAGLARFRLVRQLIAALTAGVTDPGVALFWDDVTWADPSSLEALPHVVEELSDRPLLVVLTVPLERRDAGHPLERALYRLDRQRRLARLPLGRLASEQTVALGEALLGGPVPDQLGDLLVQQTLGNPFFIEETIKALVDEGSLVSLQRGWKYDPPARHLIAQGVRAAITERLFHLPDETQAILRAASVLGRRVSLDSLALMIDSPARTVESHLQTAVAAGVIEPNDEGFEFTHDRIRDVLYDLLPLIDRRELHLAAARSLEQLPDGDLAMIPLHWRLGGNLDAAIVGELAASDVALNEGGLREALARRETAVSLANSREVDPGLRKAVLEALGDVQRHLVPRRACTAYEDALSSSGVTGEDRERLWRKLQLSHSIAGNLRAAGELPPPSDPTHWNQAQAAKAYNLALQGDIEGTRALLRATQEAQDPSITCLRHATESIIAYLTGDGDRCLRNGRIAYELSNHEPARRKEMLRYTTLWQLLRYYLTYQADVGEPMDRLAQGEVEYTSQLDLGLLEVGARSVRGYVSFFRGRWAEAAEDFDWAEAHVLSAESMLAPAVLSFFAPAFWIATGDLDRARRVLESALEPLDHSSLAPAFGTIPVMVALAQIHRLQGDRIGASRRLDQSAALQSEATVCIDGAIEVARAQIAIDQHDRPYAIRWLDQAMKRARSVGDLLTQLECHRLFGVVGSDRKSHFTTALELAEQVGSPGAELRVLHGWAAVADLPGRLQRRRSTLQVRLDNPVDHDERPHASLTNREVEVLACLAEGLNAKAIANQLCISEKTVERHVANIYAKIDVHNRVGALRYYEAHIQHSHERQNA